MIGGTFLSAISFGKWFFCPHQIFIMYIPQSVVSPISSSFFLCLCLRWLRTQAKCQVFATPNMHVWKCHNRPKRYTIQCINKLAGRMHRSSSIRRKKQKSYLNSSLFDQYLMVTYRLNPWPIEHKQYISNTLKFDLWNVSNGQLPLDSCIFHRLTCSNWKPIKHVENRSVYIFNENID